jgi:NADH-quinone oxidoreductase subunit C
MTMSDDKPTPGGDGTTDEPKEGAGPETTAPQQEKAAQEPATETPAAAEAPKAGDGDAEKKPAVKDDKPKPPPAAVVPTHNDASGDPDIVALAGAVDGAVLSADEFAGDATVTVPRDKITDVCRFLKDEKRFTFLVDLTAVDWPDREEGRFDVVYWMHRFDDNKRLRVMTTLPENEPIASMSDVWKVANWMEREAYDMFGIIFEGHPGLERILMWEGFNGHPLRKDFPVEGIDTGAAIYPDVYPPGGGPVREEELQKPEPKPEKKPKQEAKEGGEA